MKIATQDVRQAFATGSPAVTVVVLEADEILSARLIDPGRGGWRNQRRDPGRWPGPQQTG